MHNRKYLSLLTILVFLLSSCGQPEGFKEAEDGLDAAREFVRAVLDGDYTKAEQYLLKEEDDLRLFNRYEEYMRNQPEKERLGLKSADILIHSVEAPSDSVTLVNYSNTHSRKPTDLRVVKRNDQWLIDFSYTFGGGAPNEENVNIQPPTNPTDSAQ